MVFGEGAGPRAGSSHQRPWKQNAASERRGHPKGRSAAQQPRERLNGDGPMRPPDRGTPLARRRPPPTRFILAWFRARRGSRAQSLSSDDPARSSLRQSPARGEKAARPRRGGSLHASNEREIVKVSRHVGMIRPVARLVDSQRAAHSGSASPCRFIAWSNSARLFRPVATIGMFRPVACLEYRKRSPIKRLGLAEALHGAEQFCEIVETGRHDGMIRPVARFGDRQRASIKGSASPRRFVALSNPARLLRSLATSG